MKKLERYKHLFTLCANFLMLIVECLLLAFLWYFFYKPLVPVQGFRYQDYAVIGMYALLLYLFVRAMNGNRIGYLRITEMWLSQFIALVLTNGVIFFEICVIVGHGVNLGPLLFMTGVQAVIVLCMIYLTRKFYLTLYPPKDMLVVYGWYYPEELIEKVNRSQGEFNKCRSISVEEEEDVIKQKIRQHDIVILSDIRDELRNYLVKYCYKHDIRVYVTPKISDLILRGADDVHMFYTPFLLSRNEGLLIEQRFIKRTFDIVISLLGLIVLSPILIGTMIAIKLCDGGPIFYTQKRLTRGGQEFEMIKFRSMYVDSEKKGARLAAKNDDRVTPVGRVIRQLHIDELPQLINILMGEMSMVGPRPERREIAEEYKEEVREFDFRLKVKAGLTGYAQVNGKYNTTPYDKLKLDITYIENYSFWLDIKIILWTLKTLFQREATEGVDSEQATAGAVVKHKRSKSPFPNHKSSKEKAAAKAAASAAQAAAGNAAGVAPAQAGAQVGATAANAEGVKPRKKSNHPNDISAKDYPKLKQKKSDETKNVDDKGAGEKTAAAQTTSQAAVQKTAQATSQTSGAGTGELAWK